MLLFVLIIMIVLFFCRVIVILFRLFMLMNLGFGFFGVILVKFEMLIFNRLLYCRVLFCIMILIM